MSPSRTFGSLKKTIGVIVIVIVSIALVTYIVSLSLPKAPVHPEKDLTVSMSLLVSSVPVYVAEDQGFFDDEGLNMTIRYYDSGLAATDAMIRGDADLAIAAEYALAQRAFEGKDIRGIGAIDKADLMYIAGRKDHGITNASSLAGKRVGVPLRTVSEFYLNRFLVLHGQQPHNVNLTNIKRSDQISALTTGDVDAVVTAEPYLSALQKTLGPNVVVIPVQNNQYTYVVVIGRGDWVRENPGISLKFLRAINKADTWILANPEKARETANSRLKMDNASLDASLRGYEFSVSLDQSLVLAMEDESRWMIANNMTGGTQIPDFRNYLSPEDLMKINPAAVNIIR